MKTLRMVLVALMAVGAAFLATAHLVSGQEGPIVSIESGEILVGGTEVTRLSALDVGDPALCAFTIDVVYDPLVKDATHCNPDPGGNFAIAACAADYEDDGVNPDTVRVAGVIVTAEGVTGDIPLADITWAAVGSAGDSTVLDVQIVSFVDCQTPPVEIPGVTDQDGVNLIVSPTPTPTPTPSPTPPPAVGGIVEVQVSGSGPSLYSAADSSGGSSLHYYIALTGAAAAGVVALTAGAWYARRRWLR